jgi:hypothetical protein
MTLPRKKAPTRTVRHLGTCWVGRFRPIPTCVLCHNFVSFVTLKTVAVVRGLRRCGFGTPEPSDLTLPHSHKVCRVGAPCALAMVEFIYLGPAIRSPLKCSYQSLSASSMNDSLSCQTSPSRPEPCFAYTDTRAPAQWDSARKMGPPGWGPRKLALGFPYRDQLPL